MARPSLPELFASLERHDVEYVLVGGLAAILHGVPRATLDVDLLIEPSRGNAERLLAALAGAGLGTAHLVTPEELLSKEVTIFQDLLRVDAFTAIPGVVFADAWARRSDAPVAGTIVHLMSLDDLIASKRACGRPKDLQDVEDLEKVRDGSARRDS